MTSPLSADRESEDLTAMLWRRHLGDNLIVCSFTMLSNPLRYTGIIKGAGAWKPKILENREELLAAFVHARNSRNGSFAIALIRPDSHAESFLGQGLLTEEQAFGSYVQLIEFVDGKPVVYDDKETAH